MYDAVLLPTDGSAGADRAVDHAVDLAASYDAVLHVLTVLDDAALGAATASTLADLRGHRTDAVEAIADRAREAGVAVETAVREGTPHEEILAYADERGVDAVVMGTHGRSGVDRVLVGSVAERVLRSAQVPVMLVRMTAEAGGVHAAADARRRAREALAGAGHDEVSFPEEPHRTTTAWVVPARTDSGTYNVHIDAEDGSTSIARLDG